MKAMIVNVIELNIYLIMVLAGVQGAMAGVVESVPVSNVADMDAVPWAWIAVGLIIGMGVAGLVTVVVSYGIRRRKAGAKDSIPAFPSPRKKVAPKPLTETQAIEGLSVFAVSAETMDALRRGKAVHELGQGPLDEVIHVAQSLDLHEIDDDLLREKIVRCVLEPGLAGLPPRQADALWGCVLGWDPSDEHLEKQTTEMLDWTCEDAGVYNEARPIVEHSRHNIPVPDQLPLGRRIHLAFDRDPRTLLDEGASASVFRAKINGQSDVAVKISRLADYGILKNTLSEYMMLRRAQGIEAVIRLHGASCYHVGEEVFFYIVEEMAQTTLNGEFERRKAAREPYTEREVRDQIIKPLLQALDKLHERGILHRDLKPKNIYRVDGAYKMGDFEIAAYSRNETRTLDTGMFAGSPAYTTAAALAGRYGPETDINALACIGFMMLRGDLPAIDDAPGTSTLIRGIQGKALLSKDEELRQEKAKKAVQDWLIQKRGFVTQIRNSLRSSPFERFFIVPILSQGLYAKTTKGDILTAGDALTVLARIDFSEEAQEVRRTALAMAREGAFEKARKALVDFDARFGRQPHEKVEVSMHVMIGEAMKEIDELERHP